MHCQYNIKLTVSQETNRKSFISRNRNYINIEHTGKKLKCSQEQLERQDINMKLHPVVLNV
jgi:hypothetical protein